MTISLHKAVVENDLSVIRKSKDDEYRLQQKDSCGFTALEIAYLLGRIEAIKILQPKALGCIFYIPEGESHIHRLSLKEFHDVFQVTFVPSVYFKNYSELIDIRRNCPWVLKTSFLGMEQRALGVRFRPLVFSAYTAPIYIQKRDPQVGFGVFARQSISKGEYIGEYAGYVRKLSRLHKDTNEYCLHYPTKWFSLSYHAIDALYFGNALRFINHSDTPNIKPVCLVDRGIIHTVFFAIHNISEGQELTFNYGKDFWQKRHKKT
jgi:uncharacterized protein